MKKGLIVSFIVAITMITLCSAVFTANAISNNKEKIEKIKIDNKLIIENKIEDRNSLEPNFARSVSRFYLFGPIYNLTIDKERYYFESENLRGLKIYRYWSSGTGSWDFMFQVFHKKHHQTLIFDGYKFLGILKPDFICGCFHSTHTFW